MAKENERGGPGLLRRVFGRRRHENREADGGSGAIQGSGLDLAEIQGFILRGYRMPMVRQFLLTVATPAQARRQLGRLVSGDESDAPQITTAEDWHVGFALGPGDNPADAPRRTPDYCLNLGITWPGLVALEIEERVPTLSFKSFGAFIEGAAQRAGVGRRYRTSSPQNWIAGFGSGDDHVLVTLHAISPEAMMSYSEASCALFAEGDAFRKYLAPGRHGANGNARWSACAHCESALRDIPTDSVCPPFAAARNRSPRSPAAL